MFCSSVDNESGLTSFKTSNCYVQSLLFPVFLVLAFTTSALSVIRPVSQKWGDQDVLWHKRWIVVLSNTILTCNNQVMPVALMSG